MTIIEPRFPLGQTVITSHADKVLVAEDYRACLRRHVTGDWGEVCDEDREENELSLKEGFRIFSVYKDRLGTKFWIITEANRATTTVLLPEDY